MIRDKAVSGATVGNAQDERIEHGGIVARSNALYRLFDQLVAHHIHQANGKRKIEDPPQRLFSKVKQHKAEHKKVEGHPELGGSPKRKQFVEAAPCELTVNKAKDPSIGLFEPYKKLLPAVKHPAKVRKQLLVVNVVSL